MNSLFQQMTGKSLQNNGLMNGISQIKKMINLANGMKNPNQLVMQAINQHPQAKGMMDELKQSGLSPKEFFYKKANSMGVNPDEILKQLQS